MKIKINNNNKVLEGFFLACDAVKASLGSEGGLAFMPNPSDILTAPVFTKDGISIARALTHKNSEMNMGIQLAKQISARSLTENGDATTTTLVLAQAIVKNAHQNYNKKVEKGINIACEEVNKHLKKLSKKTSAKDTQKIATISANNDSYIGNIVAKAYKQSSMVSFDRHEKKDTVLEVTDGMRLSNGWMNPFMINNQSKGVFEAENAHIICYEGILEGENAVQEYLQQNSDQPIIIIAERFSDDVLIKLTDLHERRVLNICAVQCPEYDNKRKALLSDIALYTGGEVFLRGTSTEVKAGIAKKVTVEHQSTSIIPTEVPAAVKERIEQLKSQIEDSPEKEFLKKRIQNLEGISVTVLVGGVTIEEKNELYDRVEDAVCAVKSAKEEGWVAGGGSTLAYISNQMNTAFENKDVQYGYDCIKEAICAVFETICDNSGREVGDYIEAAKKTYGMGYNAHTDELSNLIVDGVIDSSRSIRLALSHAASVAKLLMSTKVVISR